MLNISELAVTNWSSFCSTLLGMYVFTGEDSTSAFKGKGKVGPLKKPQKNQKYQNAFRNLGEEWKIEDQTIADIEAFTCLMYGYPRESSMKMVRSIMLKKMVGENDRLTIRSKVDLSRLPPCRDSLIPHLQRVNHRVANYKTAAQPIFWKPYPFDDDQGWEKNENGMLEPVWCRGPILPIALVDLVGVTEEEQEEEKENSINFKITLAMMTSSVVCFFIDFEKIQPDIFGFPVLLG